MAKSSLHEALEDFLKRTLIKGRVSKGNKKLDNLISFLFITGIILAAWALIIYTLTIIDYRIPLLIWLLPGLALTPLLYKKFNEIDGMKAHWILHYILHTFMTGAFLLFGFLGINFFFAKDKIQVKKFEIIEKGNYSEDGGKSKNRKPFIIVNYKGADRKLVFSYEEKHKVNKAEYVILRFREGSLGYDIVKSYSAR